VADVAPAAQRGATTIADQVVVKVATVAARECTESTSAHNAMGRLTGRSLPSAEAVIANGRARLRMRIAVQWPTPLGEAAARVRDRVSTRVSELTGLQVDAVDVEVDHVVLAPDPAARRIR
jgi:uncharacterized alkaline shock family protein YloU